MVVPSIGHESFGLVTAEAFARGVPAVVNRLGALAELADETGAALAYSGERELDDALAAWRATPRCEPSWAERARAAYLERFTPERHLERYLELIDRGRARVILAYHAIEDGPPPLFISPELFRRHVEAIAELARRRRDPRRRARGRPARALGGAHLRRRVRQRRAQRGAGARGRGIAAAVFCVAGRIGGDNRWPGQPASVPSRPLASAEELAELAAAGWTIGSHGMDHARLDRSAALEREIVESRALIADATGAAVDWFAYPYGAVGGRDLVASTYRGAVAMGNRFADAASPAHAPAARGRPLPAPPRAARTRARGQSWPTSPVRRSRDLRD